MVVKTVSNFTVSSEKASRAEPSVRYCGSLMHEVHSTASIRLSSRRILFRFMELPDALFMLCYLV